MNFVDLKNNFGTFSLALGIISAITLTFIITVWEWVENPSGIFHDQSGTNWSFVYDTAISWFVPTLITVTVISVFIQLIIKWVHKYKN